MFVGGGGVDFIYILYINSLLHLWRATLLLNRCTLRFCSFTLPKYNDYYYLDFSRQVETKTNTYIISIEHIEH